MHSDSKGALRQLSQVQEEDMVDLLEAEELPFDDTSFLPSSSQPVELPITEYTDYVMEHAENLSRSAPPSEYYRLTSHTLSTQSDSVQEGSIQGSISSLLEENLMPTASWEHLSVRKANQVSDESGRSAFKPVTPGSSAPASRAASVVSLPPQDLGESGRSAVSGMESETYGNLSRRSSRGSRRASQPASQRASIASATEEVDRMSTASVESEKHATAESSTTKDDEKSRDVVVVVDDDEEDHSKLSFV